MSAASDQHEWAVALVDRAAPQLFDADPRVSAVGVSRYGDHLGFRVVRNFGKVLPLSVKVRTIEKIEDLPVHYHNVPGDFLPLTKLPHKGPGSPGTTSYGVEQKKHNPVCCGLQIQNYDYDDRIGLLSQGLMTVGTLGCFVQLPSSEVCLLSNNHVIAAENKGNKGKDRILQPGGGTLNLNDKIAELHDFVDLRYSPHGTTPGQGAILNVVDAAIAKLDPGIKREQKHLTYQACTIA